MKTIHWMVAALALVLLAMGGVFGLQSHQASAHAREMEVLLERVEIAQSMPLFLERYRLQNGNFRKMSEPEISKAKSDLRSGMTGALEKLSSLDATASELEQGKEIDKQLEDFMVFSAKKEPTLFLRNIYTLPEAKAQHEAMIQGLYGLRDAARSRWQDRQSHWAALSQRYSVVFGGLSAGALALLGALMLGAFFVFTRPLRRLLVRVKELRVGRLSFKGASKQSKASTSNLSGGFAEVEQALDGLATTVDMQRLERHQFVQAIVDDLKTGLVPLQTSSALLGTANDLLDDDTRIAASETVRRSSVRLGATLADLDDATRLEQDGVRLDEKVVDLREILQRASQALGGVGASHLFQVFVPSSPVWAWVDASRIERAVLALISKLMLLSPQGGQIHLSLSRIRRAGGVQDGAELRVHPTTQGMLEGPGGGTLPRATGPEQEVQRHWSSENGFGLRLAQRIAEAHGGALTAAGLPGSSVLFSLKLPETRLTPAARRGDFSLSEQPISS